jgi:ABC-2 type transport system ATP-binding protein
LTGRQILRFFASLRCAECLGRSQQIAARLGLDLDKRVATMSTGMRQKLGLAIVLAPPTDVVILDEPTSGLDPTSRLSFLELLREAQAAGRTILLSSHIIGEVEQVCDRVGLLRRGQLVALQQLDQLRGRRHVVVDLATTAPSIPADLPGLIAAKRTGTRLELIVQGSLGPVLQWLEGTRINDLSVTPDGLLALYQRHHGGDDTA